MSVSAADLANKQSQEKKKEKRKKKTYLKDSYAHTLKRLTSCQESFIWTPRWSNPIAEIVETDLAGVSLRAT